MRCLYCGKQLALFKKLTGGGEFCSDSHKQSYHEEYNKLALNRLMEAQTRQEERSPLKTAPEAAPASAPEPAFTAPMARGEYLRQPVTVRSAGGSAVAAAQAQEPVARPVDLPASAELHFAPEPAPAGVIMESRGVAGPAVALMAPAPNCLWAGREPEYHFPAFEIQTTRAPAASGPVGLDVSAAAPGEPELRYEPAAGFLFECALPDALDLSWVDGLELEASEKRLVSDVIGATEELAVVSETEAAPEPEVVAVHEPEGVAESEAGPKPEAVREPEELAVPVVSKRVRSLLDSDTPEPVIDDALLQSLFGGDDEPAPAVPVEAPAAIEAVTEPVAAVPAVATAMPPAEAVRGPVPPREPGSFLPVAIRPAGAPNKTKLMQSFQAIALVNSNPQIPAWNMLPLRPKMALGRGPGPGAALMSEARKPAGTAVEVAHEPEPAEDLSVPTFGVVTKPRTGLSRWFKMGILAGVLGVAGGLFQPAEVRGAGVAMTTEYAVCRN